MIFAHTWKKVLDGTKIVTRRLVKPEHEVNHWRLAGVKDDAINEVMVRREKPTVSGDVWRNIYCVGNTYAVQPGRGKRTIFWKRDEGGSLISTADANLKDTYKHWTKKALLNNGWTESRIRITGIRQERLQDMTTEDAIAEGIPPYTFAKGVLSDTPPDPRWKYAALWDTIHTTPGTRWADNPSVWVLAFELVEVVR